MTYEELPTLEEFTQILDRLTLVQVEQIVEANRQIENEELTSAWSEVWGPVQHPEFYDARYQHLEPAALKSYSQKINAVFKVGSQSVNRVRQAQGAAIAEGFSDAIDQVVYLILARHHQFTISQTSAKTFLTAWQPIFNNLPK